MYKVLLQLLLCFCVISAHADVQVKFKAEGSSAGFVLACVNDKCSTTNTMSTKHSGKGMISFYIKSANHKNSPQFKNITWGSSCSKLINDRRFFKKCGDAKNGISERLCYQTKALNGSVDFEVLLFAIDNNIFIEDCSMSDHTKK